MAASVITSVAAEGLWRSVGLQDAAAGSEHERVRVCHNSNSCWRLCGSATADDYPQGVQIATGGTGTAYTWS